MARHNWFLAGQPARQLRLSLHHYVFSRNPNINNPQSLYAKWGEPWLFGFPDSGAAEFVRGEGLEVVSDSMSTQNICVARVPGKK
jgi:hypothetical protein